MFHLFIKTNLKQKNENNAITRGILDRCSLIAYAKSSPEEGEFERIISAIEEVTLRR